MSRRPRPIARDPALVHNFYDARRARLGEVEPNAAHEALARLDAEWPGELLIVTQNVDDLHERAGAKRLLHMHGELTSGMVHGLRLPVRLAGGDGRLRTITSAPDAACSARFGPTSSGSARCPTKWSGSTRR